MVNLGSHKNASVFHSEEFNKIIKEVLGRKVNFFDGKDYFYITHPDKKLKFLKINYSPDPRLECVYGGVLGGKDIVRKFMGFWHITTIPGEDISEYSKRGFHVEERFTSILSLDKSEKELWKNFNRLTRRNIRRGENKGVKIIKSENIDKYYKLLKETYKRLGLKILPKEFYSKILNKLGDLFLAKYNNKIIGGTIYLKFKDTVYSWSTLSLKEFFSLSPTSLIQWEYIKYAKENGFKKFDLLGLDIPSIARWKEGFGGKRIKFYTLHSKPLYFLKKAKNLVNFIK